ncbi:MAG: MobV family relaxase [Acinetobacter sp.]
MNNFAILRTQKLVSKAKLSMASMHNSRRMDVPNADASKGGSTLIMGYDDALARYEQIIGKLNITERKNGVPAFEIMTSFSPGQDVDLNAWADAQKLFFEKLYGKHRILSMHLHTDESSPHMQTIIMPLTEKKGVWKLCCRDFLGGKDKLIKLQDEYAKAMESFGLERGIKNSKATHQKIRKYYGTMAKDIEMVMQEFEKIEKPGIFNYKDVIKKTKLMLQTALLKAAKIGDLESQIDKLKRTITSLQNFKNDISKAAKGLSMKETIEALSRASELQEEQKRVISDGVAREYRAVPVAPTGPDMTQLKHITIKPQTPASPRKTGPSSKSEFDI